MKYIVVEVQHFPTDQVATFVWAFDAENSANAKYHQTLSGAAVSSLPVHGCVMFTEEGSFLKGECFKHEQPEPEPEIVEEPEPEPEPEPDPDPDVDPDEEA